MQIYSVGIDLGKTTFHLVGLGTAGTVLVRKKFTQKQLVGVDLNAEGLHGTAYEAGSSGGEILRGYSRHHRSGSSRTVARQGDRPVRRNRRNRQ